VKWAEITVRCAPDSIDAVSAALTDAGCGGTAVQDGQSGSAGAAEETGPLPAAGASKGAARVTGYLPVDDRLEARLEALQARLRKLPDHGLAVEEGMTLRTVQDQDWESAWKAYFKPLRVGRCFVVKPSWEEYTPRPGDLVLELDPGMAFGTGAHPTTQLCLEALEGLVRPEERVLDFGTGSGILSLAAARLGASVIGLDTDPVAASAADLNVTANHLRDRVRIQGGDLEALAPDDRFDGVVANILAGVILEYADGLAQRCRPGGWLVASGIIDHRADTVVAGLRASGFGDVQRLSRCEWVALVARRASPESRCTESAARMPSGMGIWYGSGVRSRSRSDACCGYLPVTGSSSSGWMNGSTPYGWNASSETPRTAGWWLATRRAPSRSAGSPWHWRFSRARSASGCSRRGLSSASRVSC
jgi:ribosomal protein L11 methyltransferase